jgi:rhomboid protease GluP
MIIPGINNWAHGGGIVGGILLGWLLGYEGRSRETTLHTALALLCAIATVAALGWAVLTTFLH